MKLNKLKFAKLVAHCVSYGMSAGEYEVNTLDEIVDIDIPVAAIIQPSVADINMLMFLMSQGTQKIEAIKIHRKLTGYGLKESKDEVEKYWMAKPLGTEPKSEAPLDDILKKAR